MLNLINRIISFRRSQKLAYRLVLYVILCSSVFTLFATGIQLYASYRMDLDYIESSFKFVEKSYVPAISTSLYKVDIEQLKLQLHGILQLHDLVSVEVEEPRGQEVFRIFDGDRSAIVDKSHQYPLKFKKTSGEIIKIGTLTVAASFKGVYARLLDRIIIVIVTNAGKTFFASFCILLIFYFAFTRHISKIGEYVHEIKPEFLSSSMVLNRKNPEERRPDELDDLVSAINYMLQKMKEYSKERIQAEENLRKTEQRYRTVADFTYDWEYWQSPEGKMIYVSPSCERISGYDAEAFMNDSDLMPEIILREDRSLWADHRLEARSKPGSFEIMFRIRTKDDEIRWIEHACQPVYNAEGKSMGIRASNRDITLRKNAEDELRSKEQMLEDSQRIARLGSWEWDILTNQLKWSDEVFRVFGLSSQNLSVTYEDFLERTHPDDREDVKKAVNRALSDPSFNYNITHRIRRPDGSERIVRERGKVAFDDNTGKASHMIGTVQDITDVRKVEMETERLRAELSHMDRVNMMGVLTAGIAHEINQPLAAILSNAQAAIRFMTNDPQDLEEVKEALHDIIADDKRAGELVRSIRNIAGKYDPNRKEMDLNETVMEILTLLNSEALDRGIILSESLQADIPPVYGDRVQIQQVTLNLMINAMEVLQEHNLSKPEIIVSTRFKENKDVILSVSDSGPGIAPDQLNVIFNSFETNKKGGLGIGLPICRLIADKHDGQIWAENRPEGGATFFFRLPPLLHKKHDKDE